MKINQQIKATKIEIVFDTTKDRTDFQQWLFSRGIYPLKGTSYSSPLDGGIYGGVFIESDADEILSYLNKGSL